MDYCYRCKIELTRRNRSIWYSFVKLNEEIVTVPQCKRCDEKDRKDIIGKKID